VARLNPWLAPIGPQPLRWAVLLYLLSMLISYSIGLLRGLTTMEANSADRWLILIAIFTGIMLVAADGVPNWARFYGVFRVFVWCSAVMAVVGVIQYMSAVDITQYIKIPGLVTKGFVPGFEVRGAGLRVASTTTHYIEFAAIMAMALPFSLQMARHSPTKRQRQAGAVAAALIALAVPTTVSRTGFISLALVGLVMFFVWDNNTRRKMATLGVLFAVLGIALKPKLVTTVFELFTGASQDRSVTSRTERYSLVWDYFSERPWFGRGTGTWVFPQYIFLDNQWFSIALTNGVFGVVALAVLHIMALTLAILAFRRASTQRDRELCGALIATQPVAIFVGFTFDSLSFSTYAIVCVLMIGLCGSAWRLTHPARSVRTSAPKRS
jgi:O-antigen ligase